jgi:NDP-sugar pyrophosphorylase family protein
MPKKPEIEKAQIAILAGGLATRLYPATKDIPKSLIEVAGRPFIAHQLDLLGKNGITSVVICAGHLGKRIVDYVKDGMAHGITVRFSFDGDKQLGTGGALRKALPLLDDPFMVEYGDSYLDTDYQAIMNRFIADGRSGLLTIFRNDNKFGASNIVYSRGEIIMYNKKVRKAEMHYIDYGLSLLKKKVFNDFDGYSAFDFEKVIQRLCGANDLAAHVVENRFYEIGSPEGLAETRRYLNHKAGGG